MLYLMIILFHFCLQLNAFKIDASETKASAALKNALAEADSRGPLLPCTYDTCDELNCIFFNCRLQLNITFVHNWELITLMDVILEIVPEFNSPDGINLTIVCEGVINVNNSVVVFHEHGTDEYGASNYT